MSALNPAKELKALLRVVLLVVASPLCFAIDLVSTNSLGMQGPLTDEPRASAISNDGNSVLFVSSDPTLVPGERGNFYVKTMSRNSIVQLVRRTDGLPLESGFPNIYAVMDEPPTRVLFATNEGNLGPGIGASGPKILATIIGSFQYLAARGIMGGPAMQFADFAVNSRLDRIYLQTLEPLPVVSSGYQLAEVSATLATAPIVHTLRTDGLVSQVAGSAPNFANLPSISASADGRIVSWGACNSISIP